MATVKFSFSRYDFLLNYIHLGRQKDRQVDG